MEPSLRTEITELLGPNAVSENGTFGFQIETKEDDEQIRDFVSRHSNEIEELPSGSKDIRIFRILPSIQPIPSEISEMEKLPAELTSMIYDYLPDDDPLILREQLDPLHLQEPFIDSQQQFRDLSMSRSKSLTTVVKDEAIYFQWLRKHHNLTNLHLIIPERFMPEQRERIFAELGMILDSMGNLESLKINRVIFYSEFKSLAATFERLDSLDLDFSELDETPSDADFHELANLKNLVISNFEFNSFDDIVRLFRALVQNPHLISLNVEDCSLTLESFDVLFEILTTHPQLRGLDISGTVHNISRTDLDRVVGRLTETLPQLHYLETLGIGNFILESASAPGFIHALGTLTNLIYLDIGGIIIFDNLYPLLGATLAELPNITHFLFAETEYSSPSMIPFFRTHPNLVELDLTGSFNEDEGTAFAVFAPYIAKMTHLEKLSLGEVDITTEEFRVLTMMLSSLTSLTELNLSECSIKFNEQAPVDLFVDALMRCPNLRKIDLGENTFTPGIFELFIPLFKKGFALEEINLRYCELTSEELNRFVECFPSMPNLKILNIEGNDFTDFDYPQFYYNARTLVHLQRLHFTTENTDDGQANYKELMAHLPDLL